MGEDQEWDWVWVKEALGLGVRVLEEGLRVGTWVAVGVTGLKVGVRLKVKVGVRVEQVGFGMKVGVESQLRVRVTGTCVGVCVPEKVAVSGRLAVGVSEAVTETVSGCVPEPQEGVSEGDRLRLAEGVSDGWGLELRVSVGVSDRDVLRDPGLAECR